MYMQRHVTEWMKFLPIRTQANGASYSDMDSAQVAIHVLHTLRYEGFIYRDWRPTSLSRTRFKTDILRLNLAHEIMT